MNSNIANMKQAVFEMFGVGSGTEIEIVTAEVAETVSEEISVPSPQPIVEAAPTTPVATVPVRAAVMSYIAAGTVFEGTMRCDGDVEVAGEIIGDVKATGAVNMYAAINGNVSAGRLTLTGCTLTGDATVSDSLTVGETASVCGNVQAKDVHCAGKINGNLDLSGNITLERTANIHGDISADSFTVEKGAVICGNLDIKNT